MSNFIDAPILIPAFHRIHDYVGVWAITETAAQAMESRARRTDWAAHFAVEGRRALPQSALSLVPSGGGKSVALVSLDGTLMKAGTSFGGTSTVQARKDIRKAVADPDVSSILLVIDSPGGTVSGTDDLAAEVKAARKTKPVWAFVQDLCASAAYWVASQAEEVWVNSETAWVGSIGTYLALYDLSKAAAKEGVEAVVFRTGPLKGAAAADGDPLTPEQRTHFQGLVDSSQKTFDAAVQKGRSLTDKQLAAVRTGGVFTASEAVTLKLADGVRPFESTLSALVKRANSRSPQAGRNADLSPPGDTMSVPTAAAGEVITLTVADETAGTTATTTQAKPAAPADPLAQFRAQQAAELRRQAAVLQVAAGHPSIAADAVEHGWSVEKTELMVYKAGMPKPPAPINPHVGNGAGSAAVPKFERPDAAVLESAIMLAGGIDEKAVAKGLPAADRERVMNVATGQEYQGFTLSTLMRMSIAAAGMACHSPAGSPAFLQAFARAEKQHRAGGAMAGAGGFSTISVSGVLGNTANRSLMAGYEAAEVTWRFIAAIRSHSDFKTRTQYRLDGSGALKKVGQDGEIKHVGMTETAFTNRLDTYAGMLALTRQMQINDDLGAFTGLQFMLGQMGAGRIEEAVYVLLLSNAGSFFSVGNKNLISGAGSALTVAGTALQAAEGAFMRQVDPNGKPIAGRPRRMLVPTALATIADTLYTETNIDNGGNTTPAGSTNRYRGRYAPQSSPYLDNTAITDQDGSALSGQSSTAWYLFMDPAVRAAVGVAFLNGQQRPTVETEDAPFNVLGQQWRTYIDFGVGFEDPAAAQKNAGA